MYSIQRVPGLIYGSNVESGVNERLLPLAGKFVSGSCGMHDSFVSKAVTSSQNRVRREGCDHKIIEPPTKRMIGYI
jgi:hypothetical protein